MLDYAIERQRDLWLDPDYNPATGRYDNYSSDDAPDWYNPLAIWSGPDTEEDF